MGKFKFPSAYTILFFLIAVVAVLTWIVPAGQYHMAMNEALGKDVPTSFLQFTGDDINLTAPGTITVKAATIVLDGPVQGTETADFEGDVTGEGISLAHHTHGGVQTGGGNTGEPNG